MYFDDEQEWKVSGILQHKKTGARKKYMVVYSGYNESEAYLLPESELGNALEIFNDYKASHSLT